MIDKKTVEHIAKLARLKLSDAEAQEYSATLTQVLGHFEQISNIDTKEVEPLITPVEIAQVWRCDESKQEITTEEILQNAPHKTGHLFTVPPVV